MASPGSYIRSAARATSYAYRRVPVRWRLGGGSAALTFVILAVFAGAVGVLTDHQINNEFNDGLAVNVEHLKTVMIPERVLGSGGELDCTNHVDLSDFARATQAQIEVMTDDGTVKCTQLNLAGEVGVTRAQLKRVPAFTVPPQTLVPYVQDGFRIDARPITWKPHGHGYVLYARPLSSVTQTIGEIRVWLTLGVLGGAVLALLAGLFVADRAMRPIAELTEVAREIERTRNPTLSIPQPEAEDEVSELARTLEAMLSALADARNESVTALRRQREFVADASHELRTPLTSVLANLELLADELSGEQSDSAKAALRATRRMRRLVSDLLLLARADVERPQTRTTVDLADALTDAAAELGPVAEDHLLEIAPGHALLLGLQDDLHRMVLNLVENAIHHTPPGTRIHAASSLAGDTAVLVVEDDGPGIAPEIQDRVFERFVRGGGDSGARGTGLGLSIVSAVANAHGATVTLTSLPQLQGTRFEIRFPAQTPPVTVPAPPARRPSGRLAGGKAVAGKPASGAAGETQEAEPAQTSTTTGSTIGRRRSRS